MKIVSQEKWKWLMKENKDDLGASAQAKKDIVAMMWGIY